MHFLKLIWTEKHVSESVKFQTRVNVFAVKHVIFENVVADISHIIVSVTQRRSLV